MKRIFVVIVLIVAIKYGEAQTKAAKLIVRADDMGFAHSGNLALIKTWKEGIATSIEVIVPSPWFPEAVKLLAENPAIDVGIHLAITSEWDNIKWRPVSDCSTLKDEDGYFYPMIWPNKNYPDRAILDHPFKIQDIEKEFRAQIELALKYIPRISHISGHMGCTGINPEVKQLVEKLSREYKIHIDLAEKKVKNIGFNGPHKTFKEKKAGFLATLESLQPGNIYMFVEHPAFDDAEMRAIHHIGYENVAEDRQGVTDLFTDEEVKAFIKKKNIQLINYKDLLKE